MTRRQAAHRLGISVSGLRRLEADGVLHATPDARGVGQLDDAEIEAFAAATPTDRAARAAEAGRIAARAFERFAEGATLRDLVVELEQPPEALRALYREWSTGWREGEQDARRREAREREARELRDLNREYDREAERWNRALDATDKESRG